QRWCMRKAEKETWEATWRALSIGWSLLGFKMEIGDEYIGLLLMASTRYDPRVPPKETSFVRGVKVGRAVCVFVLAQYYAEKQALWVVSSELLDTRVNLAVWEA
ncbi:hypothetical protein Tco_1137136, partial [Tanacetum coccineum]